MVSPIFEIVIGLSVAVGASLLIFIGNLIRIGLKNSRIFFHKVHEAFAKIDHISKEMECRKKETQLLFKSQLIQLDIMNGEKINGQVTELRKEIEEFNIYKEGVNYGQKSS